MLTKTPLFFPSSNSPQHDPIDSPLEKVKKYIDALLDYNQTLILQLDQGSSKETLEIILSMLVNSSDIPQKVIQVSEQRIQRLKQGFINQIQEDLKDYELFKVYANHGNLDYTYLNIFFTHQNWLLNIQEVTAKKITLILSHLFKGNEFKKIASKAQKNINQKNVKSPIMAEINILNEMLEILKPQVSNYCIKFTDDTKMTKHNHMIGFFLNERFEAINKKLYKLLAKKPNDPEAILLLDRNLEVDKALNGYKFSKNLNISYLFYFEKTKLKYEIETQIERLLEQTLSTQQAVKLSQIPKIKKIKSQSHNASQLAPKLLEKPLGSIKLSSECINSEKSPVKNDVQIEQALQPPIESTLQLAPVIQPDIIIEKQEGIDETPISIQKQEKTELEINLTEEEENDCEINGEEEKEREQTEFTYTPNYKTFNKKKEMRESTPPKFNILNLNKDQRETFLKVFALKPNVSINLRALVNLTLAMGGTFKTSGSNRCRIEIKNIYAFLGVGVPEEAVSQACAKATITMHGGGHRNNRSQNCDREQAPRYLIVQFHNAFERAGYTPESLGLIDEPHDLSNNCK